MGGGDVEARAVGVATGVAYRRLGIPAIEDLRDIPTDRWPGELPPANLVTTVPGVFAAGDIRAGFMKRVAAAAGEGSSVVPLVHTYLAPVT
jgi:thioredoxin reductase